MGSSIPIRNIYYLLCYAWNRLEEGEVVDVSGIDSTELADLFATVLIHGIHHLSKRGLEQGYEAQEEELVGVRGRIEIGTTTRRMLMAHGKTRCLYDEISINTLPNRILKSTSKVLAGVPTLDKDLKSGLVKIIRQLAGIDDIRINKFTFRKIQLHGNNRFYKFLLSVCEMIQESWIVDENTGSYKFRDFLQDEIRMAQLYESFILNFYKLERPDLEVKKERIYWSVKSESERDLKYLPTMETDVSIRSGSKTLIVDAKYYKEALQSYYDSEKIHSSNLYQMFAYLKNLESRGGLDALAEGMLLYPAVGKQLRLKYDDMGGHKIRICTINLSNEWRDIRSEMLELLEKAI